MKKGCVTICWLVTFFILNMFGNAYAQDKQGQIEQKITQLKQKQAFLEQKIDRFQIDWDMHTKLSSINTSNFSLNMDSLKTVLPYNDYWILHDVLKDGNQNTKASTSAEGKLMLRFSSDQLRVKSEWKVSTLWGGANDIKLKNVLFEANLGTAKVVYGTLERRFTPLTLWYPYITPDILELDVFRRERERSLERSPKQNERLLTGVDLRNNIGSLYINAIATKVGPSNTQKYVWGIQGTDFIKKDAYLGFVYLQLADLPGLAGRTSAMNNKIMSVFFSQQLLPILSIGGEFAKSLYQENIYDDAFEPIEAYAQNITLSVGKNPVCEFNYLRTDPFYNALTVSVEDVMLNSLNILNSSYKALPYGDATPNRVGWKRAFRYRFSKGIDLFYASSRFQNINYVVNEYGESLLKFNTSDYGLELWLNKLFSLPSKMTSMRDLKLSILAGNEKTENVQGQKDKFFLSNFGVGLSGKTKKDIEWSWGRKRFQDEVNNTKWEVGLFAIGKNIDPNVKLSFTRKTIGYSEPNGVSDFTSQSDFLELRVSY